MGSVWVHSLEESVAYKKLLPLLIVCCTGCRKRRKIYRRYNCSSCTYYLSLLRGRKRIELGNSAQYLSLFHFPIFFSFHTSLFYIDHILPYSTFFFLFIASLFVFLLTYHTSFSHTYSHLLLSTRYICLCISVCFSLYRYTRFRTNKMRHKAKRFIGCFLCCPPSCSSG